MQTNAQQIHPDVTNSDHHKANHSHKSWASALPTATEAGVQISGIHQPADQGPGFLGIPAPVAAPGFIRPNSTTHDAHRKHQEPNRDRAITEAVELLIGAQLNRLQLNRTTIRDRGRLTISTTANGTAPQFQGLAAIGDQHRQGEQGSHQQCGVTHHDHAHMHDQPAGAQGRNQRSR